MKDILIYLNIPWNFIKQRPQFMAEKLSEHFNVLVYYNRPYKSTYLVEHNKDNEKVRLIARPKIPRKNTVLKKLDNRLQHFYLKKLMRFYEYIWVMHPNEFEIVKDYLEGKKLIYDCMDDYSQFPHLSEEESQNLKRLEKDLIERADYVFYTSKALREVHEDRYNVKKQVYVINNAFEPYKEIVEDTSIKDYMYDIKGKKLVYIGAIASWFDIKLIEQTLQKNTDISVVLFGPLEIELPSIERLYHFGKIPHDSIYTAMKYADALIMPFYISELILAVDPIKIYEYIYSGKKVIVPSYPEMDKFKEFVYIYHDAKEFIEMTSSANLESEQNVLDSFIQQNTWRVRADQVKKIINKESVCVLITGAKGQLGMELHKQLTQVPNRYEVIAVGRDTLDITNPNEVDKLVQTVMPNIIINCAAYTQVDECEENKEQAYNINEIGAKNLAMASEQIGAKLIHISTDYVFSGNFNLPKGLDIHSSTELERRYEMAMASHPWTEEDEVVPQNVYGKSKLAGEEAVREHCKKHFILRTAWLYGEGNNFVRTMLKLAKTNQEINVVGDQYGTPTYTKDLAAVIINLMQTEYYGTYHATCEGMCSWYDFALEIFKLKEINVKVNKVTSEEFVRPAKRPKYSVLDNANLKKLGMNTFRPWQEALEEYLEIDVAWQEEHLGGKANG